MTEEFIKNILTETLFGYKVCENQQDLNIVNYFYSNLLLEKLLHGESLNIQELRKLLRKKIVNFEFIKIDGSVRPAKGTLMMKYIPPRDHPKGIRPSSPKVATFFDLDKDAWRSVSRRSKEIVLKKDEKTDKPIIVVKDKSKVKVKPVAKERESVDPIEQGKTYKYTTNRGTNTYVEIVRELSNGLFQVSSPLFKTTFAIDPIRIGNKFNTKEEEPKENIEEPKEKEPEEIKPLKTNIVKPTNVKSVKAVEKPKEPEEIKPEMTAKPITNVKSVKAVEKPKIEEPKKRKSEPEATILLPKKIKSEEEGETKSPPIDITPPERTERPEDLGIK